MSAEFSPSRATITTVRGCLVVTFGQDLAESLTDTRIAVLDEVRNSGARVVVLELSAVRFMDRTEFGDLRELVEMTRLMGARPFMVGLEPGIVAYLVNNDADTRGLEVARALEDVFDVAGIELSRKVWS